MRRLIKNLAPGRVDALYRAWERERRLSPLGRSILAGDRRGPPANGLDPRTAVRVATDWLCRAQDRSRTADGGVARDFSLVGGWAASYPETTGYIVPTLIAVAKREGRPELLDRCRSMLDWMVAIQLPGGGFQGGRVDQAPVVPVTFNTGQILLGLAAGAAEFNDGRYGEAMHRAAVFLRDSLDPDGCWRGHPTPFAGPGDKAYETHVSWGLFEAARVAPGHGYGEAGLRQVDWALTCQRPNGWFEKNCLVNPDAPLTHTIGYVLRGVIEAFRFSGRQHLLQAALKTAAALTRCVGDDGRIAGRLDRDWRPAADYVCLTGSAQIAACWFLLAEITCRPEFAAAARAANGFVRRTVRATGDPDIVGGVQGSFPVDGEYGRFEYLNWAVKFFIDACLMEMSSARGSDRPPAGREERPRGAV